MSASLVGSEMCIRDRSNLRSSSHSQSQVPSVVRLSAFAPGPQCRAINSCLLYTSDAADDMP
eukprot:4386720-Alexandrium_andersonii.AAC.1